MSRWSRRSKKKKDAILKKLEKPQLEKREWTKRHEFDNSELVAEIYKKGEIPIYCMKDGWTWSNKYVFTEEETIFGKHLMIRGHCKDCGRPIERVIHRTVGELMSLPFVAATLEQQGRLEDRRKENASN